MAGLSQIFTTEHDYMIAPIELKLPSGLQLVMYPRPEKRNGWKVVEPGETEAELWERFTAALRSTDFSALSRAYNNSAPVLLKKPADATAAA